MSLSGIRASAHGIKPKAFLSNIFQFSCVEKSIATFFRQKRKEKEKEKTRKKEHMLCAVTVIE